MASHDDMYSHAADIDSEGPLIASKALGTDGIAPMHVTITRSWLYEEFATLTM
jgi:hypothetical protein